MAEKVKTLKLERDYKKWLYYIDGKGNVCRKEKSLNGASEILVANAVERAFANTGFRHTEEYYEARDRMESSVAAASVPVQTARHGIYIASKTKHAAKWKALRESGVPIISTWIDEAGEGETASYEDLWRRCIEESKSAAAFIVYAEPGETLKGALVEMGAAIAAGTPVFSVGEIGKPLWESILTTKCASIEEALLLANRTAPAATKEK